LDKAAQTHIQTLVEAFRPFAFDKSFGFEAFELNDVVDFLSNPSQFEFSLKKLRQKNLLYAPDHVQLRQQMINGLPFDIKMGALLAKFKQAKLPDILQAYVGKDCTIADITDIGMGHSVYCVTLKTAEDEFKKVVVKREDLPNQTLFCRLLLRLGWPSFRSMHFDEGEYSWEISDFLGDQSLEKILPTLGKADGEFIEKQLAMHAALGYILGRGDRHFENYLVGPRHELWPIDISFLFREDNEFWDVLYITGGRYELNILQRESASNLPQKMNQFFTTYKDTLKNLKNNEELLQSHLLTFFSELNLQTSAKLQFVNQRLHAPEDVVAQNINLAIDAFFVMKERQIFKQWLLTLFKAHPEIVWNEPLLKMYYLTDTNRQATFFLLENHPQVIPILKKHMEVFFPQLLADFPAQLDQIKQLKATCFQESF